MKFDDNQRGNINSFYFLYFRHVNLGDNHIFSKYILFFFSGAKRHHNHMAIYVVLIIMLDAQTMKIATNKNYVCLI